MNIEKFCEIYNFGNVINITKLTGGLMHKMYKVETNKGIYCVKVLNSEVMSRKEAYNNFIISESISNLAKENGIPVSSALSINGDYLKEVDGYYYMIFDYINGKTITDNDITIDDCKSIGSILGKLHSIDYTCLNIEEENELEKYTINFEYYLNHKDFNNKSYRELYLKNYKRYESVLKRCVERFNYANDKKALCHRDMDPKNVMKDEKGNLIVIDWEAATLSNPYIEMIETALCWSGFLTNQFDDKKFRTIIKEYNKYNPIEHKRYETICGNLVSRFKWLEYNLKRSLGIVTKDQEEILLGEKEVIKTIDEINRYLEMIGLLYDIVCEETKKENKKYDEYAETIVNNVDILKGFKLDKINAGFTNAIFSVGDYIIRICIDSDNESKFINEINFYKEYSNNVSIPQLFYSDTTKTLIPYCFEIIEKVKGKTLYDIWYKIDEDTKKNIIKKMIDILKIFHLKETNSIDFESYLKDCVKKINEKCTLDIELYNALIKICDKYFKENTFGIIHNDLHFDNFIYDGDNLYLLDFERNQIGPIDYDFKILSTCRYMPWLWASGNGDMLAVESDYEDIIDFILDSYEELNKIPNVKERIEFYAIIELLENYKNSKNEEILELVKNKVKQL